MTSRLGTGKSIPFFFRQAIAISPSLHCPPPKGKEKWRGRTELCSLGQSHRFSSLWSPGMLSADFPVSAQNFNVTEGESIKVQTFVIFFYSSLVMFLHLNYSMYSSGITAVKGQFFKQIKKYFVCNSLTCRYDIYKSQHLHKLTVHKLATTSSHFT